MSPPTSKTFEEYGLRFDIEENFLDDKSNGFQLESSLIRSANALERLCCVLAITTLYLVAQGTAVVTQGKRRWVDAHWFRGQSYLKIGWNWVKLALSRGYELITQLASIRGSRSCTRHGLKNPASETTSAFLRLWSSKMPSPDRLEFCQSIRS